MKDDAQISAIKQMAGAASVVRAYAGSDSAHAMTAMLDALIESYKLDLMYVTPEGLTRLQAAIQQTASIRAVIADESRDIPKI